MTGATHEARAAPSLRILPPLREHTPRLFTAADVAVMPSEVPSGTVCYELDHGRLLTMPPPGDVHGAVVGNIVAALYYLGQQRGHGKARSRVGVLLERNPDHLLGPDALFIANASLPTRCSPEGYLETIPDLVVEVRSKNDTGPAVQGKVDDYLRAGVRVVWVADPEARTVTAHRRGVAPQVFGENDTLTVEDVIPGFQLPIRDALRV
jgi:Uma2 family endonuclease